MEFDLIQYYCREKYYHSMQATAESALKKSFSPVIKFQYCISLILQNKIGESLRELESLTFDCDINLSVMLAIIHAQNLCEVPDSEALLILENKIKSERKCCSELSLYYAANLFLQFNDFGKAHEYLDLLFRLNPTSTKGFLIKGWLEYYNGKFTNAADSFRAVLSQETYSLEASLGEILTSSFDDAITKLNQLIVKYPKLTLPLVEKLKLLIGNKNWEQSLDIVNRIISIDSACVFPLQIKIVENLCVRGNTESLSNDIENLILAIKRQEPNNWSIYVEFSQVLSRTYGHNMKIMKESMKLIEEAAKIAPNNITVNLELGYQNYLLKNYQKAFTIYKKIARSNDTSSEALIGLTKCRLVEKPINEEIRQQISFLKEINDFEENAELLLLQSVLESNNKMEKLLKKAIDLKFNASSKLQFGMQFLIVLHASFILDCTEKLISIDNISYKIDVLRRLLDSIPGLIEAWLLLSKIYIIQKNYEEAKSILDNILTNLDSQNIDANLMFVRILIYQKKFEEAKSNLDLCLSQNLSIRSKPLFHFLLAIIQKNENNFLECINSLQNALNYITESDSLEINDMATLYLDLSSCYQVTKNIQKASEYIQKAAEFLEGTPEQDQLLISRADLELWKNNIDDALSLLSTVDSNSPMYLNARTKIADIHLKYQKDFKKYVECYKNLAKEYPTQENLIKLAEAYFSARLIPDAIDIYEKAIKQKSNPELSKKLAQLYRRCHQYGNAMRCYRDAGIEGSLELAQLLFTLKQWETAELTLSKVPLLDKALLLSQIKEKLENIPAALNILKEAYKLTTQTNAALATKICCKIADYEKKIHNFESAIKHYKLAMSHCENNLKESFDVKISLAKLYLHMNDWSACQTMCTSMLSDDPDNESALFMTADLSFKKCDFLSAFNLLHKLLSQKPNYWLALARIIEVKRRMGNLKESKIYLDNSAPSNENEPGFLYCTGLFNWFNNNLTDAIKFFNLVRQDAEWGQEVLHNMIKIYLLSYEQQEIVEKILQEIQPNLVEEEINRNLLLNFMLLSSKDKQSVEKAVNELSSIASRDVLRVGASLGLAIGYTLLKQQQRARNVLKIIAKTSWQYEEAEYLERCWLMLASHYVQSGKHDLAYELIKKILYYNNGCIKAHELCGIIAEKDQKYGNAAHHYCKAWTISENHDTDLAYRLGLYYLKNKKYVEAISVCQAILRKHPEFSKLKKDIYEKSLSLLRT